MKKIHYIFGFAVAVTAAAIALWPRKDDNASAESPVITDSPDKPGINFKDVGEDIGTFLTDLSNALQNEGASGGMDVIRENVNADRLEGIDDYVHQAAQNTKTFWSEVFGI